LSDAVTILNYLFTGGDTPGCLDAADADDSGVLNITDPIFLLASLFLGHGEELPAPALCGSDPTRDDLICAMKGCK
jgi:hypothetical protein